MKKTRQVLRFRKDASPAEVNEGKGWTVEAVTAWAKAQGLTHEAPLERSGAIQLRGPGGPEAAEPVLPPGASRIRIPVLDVRDVGSREVRAQTGAEVRLVGTDKKPLLEGHAAVFNELSEDLGGFREIILPGAFTNVLDDDIRALWNHDHNLVLGRNTAETLELEEDDTGLAFRIRPPDTSWFRDKVVNLRRGDVTGCSFAFWVLEDEWLSTSDGSILRRVHEFEKLFEVSPGCTFPAYPQTDVALRRLEAWRRAQAPAPPEAVSPASAMLSLRRKKLVLMAHRL